MPPAVLMKYATRGRRALNKSSVYPLAQTGGPTWNVVNTTTDIASFSASTCSGYGSSALCIAVGADYRN